ncbi:hypothetical protein KP509_39G060200 [Ceratopteris richardii]|uniref:ZF-HD dimerization-type domain-containing protein n=1 Tax=Ceratopteris richardii TaxID=49495 RepID=A0A8T2Q1R5_CERRI|nr:hypothetical protein KP509_39G060200 [Ceratopteris richardii]
MKTPCDQRFRPCCCSLSLSVTFTMIGDTFRVQRSPSTDQTKIETTHKHRRIQSVNSGNYLGDDSKSWKPVVRYWECQRNHAASMGGHAVDGCGEFLPAGKEGTLEVLKCAVCSCHRNFHRHELVSGCVLKEPQNDATKRVGGRGKWVTVDKGIR